MAGLFGFFDYTKSGPGVSKNGPQKKRFFEFWELYFRKFFRLCIADLLYLLVSIPVVTGGMAEVGLTYVTRNYVREKHAFLPDDFFGTIKKNWKQALGMQLLDIVVTAVMAIALWFYGYPIFSAETEGSMMSTILFALMIMIVVTWRVMRYYVYLQMITFRMTLKQILKNSLKFVLISLKENFIISVVLLAIYAFLALVAYLFYPLSTAIVSVVFLLFVPAFRSFLIQFMIFPVIKRVIIDPYYEEHPDEDIEARRDLNIETNETEDKTDDVIFEDRSEEEYTPSETVIPKQYSADEMRRAKRYTRDDADDDGTI